MVPKLLAHPLHRKISFCKQTLEEPSLRDYMDLVSSEHSNADDKINSTCKYPGWRLAKSPKHLTHPDEDSQIS